MSANLKIAIIKTGSTHARLSRIFGDFDQWFRVEKESVQFTTCDAEGGESLPDINTLDGVIITGSPCMVSDKAPWSVNLETWVQDLAKTNVCCLAVCYGHQLLAEALGGRAGWHPKGREIGTVHIELTAEGKQDSLLGELPTRFTAQVTHAQSALVLPPQATLLASNPYEPHHAFRVGERMWAIQFHPEFNADIMRGYVFETAERLLSEQRNVSELLSSITPADANQGLIKRFVDICRERTEA